jgi:hypothetical protein
MSSRAVRHLQKPLVKAGVIGLTILAAMVYGFQSPTHAQDGDDTIDPTAWGDDHVDKVMPQFTEGGECLFCHRSETINKWDQNRHQRTMRLATPEEPAMAALIKEDALADIAPDVWLILGANEHARFLKKSPKYGHAEILTTKWDGDELHGVENAAWNEGKFNESCAGCHASGVDRETLAYQAVAHDCFVCHGDVPTTHAAKPEEALFAKTAQHGPLVETAICASCHVRTGESTATGRPYPTNFVPGDNLFKDFQMDLSEETIAASNPIDAHVLMNVRDVVLRGNTSETCMTCHDVHTQSTAKHELLKTREDCYVCHQKDARKSEVPPFDVHSAVCEY